MVMTFPAVISCGAAAMEKNTAPNAKTAARNPNMGGVSRHATERINNRLLNDYGLHYMFIHTKEHYSFMTTMIGICILLDARYKQQVQTEA